MTLTGGRSRGNFKLGAGMVLQNHSLSQKHKTRHDVGGDKTRPLSAMVVLVPI